MFKDGIVVFDGGIGTTLYERGFYINRPFEELNLSAPDEVLKMHQDFVAAGADYITTNTFASTKLQLKRFDIEQNQEAIITAAIHLAHDAVYSHNRKIAMSLGPLGELLEPLGRISAEEATKQYFDATKVGAQTGLIDLIFFETFTNLRELEAAIAGARKASSTLPIIASISVKSTQQTLLESFLINFGSRQDISAIAFNCSEGPSDLLEVVRQAAPYVKHPIIVRPNAGVPKQINGRYFYMTSPDYLAKFAKRFVEAGASGVGGCCGTGPEHIAAIKRAVCMAGAQKKGVSAAIKDPESRQKELLSWERRSESQVGKKLEAGEKIISIEINPPKGTDLTKMFEKIKTIQTAGVEFVNVPDNARANTRISSLHVAAAVANHQELNVTVIPHFTARDRNLIGLQADMLGVSANGVHDILLVTGDPPKLGNNREATGIYDVDAIGMVHLADCLNKAHSVSGEALGSSTGFGIGVASNPTAINLELERERWQYKVEMGADYAITQPIFDPDTLKRWLDSIQAFHRPHIIGIWPLVSLRNAEFLANEVPGIHVPLDILTKFDAVRSKEDGIKLGLELAKDVMEKVASICDGYCISAPLGKVDVALELV